MSTGHNALLHRYDEVRLTWVPIDRGTFRVAPTITVQAAAYASGDVIGGLIEVVGAGGTIGDAITLQDVVLAARTEITGAVDLVIFDREPTGSTFTENAAYSLAAADAVKVRKVIVLTSWSDHGTPNTLQTDNLTIPMVLDTNETSFWAVIVARAAITFAGTGDLTAVFHGYRG